MAAITPTRRGKRVVIVFTLAFIGLFVYLWNPQQWSWYKSETSTDSLLDNPVLQLQGLIHTFKHLPNVHLPQGVEDATILTPSALGVGDDVEAWTWIAHARKAQTDFPLVVFSKSYCPYSQRAKTLLESYKLSPPPLVIEVDLRPDTRQVKALLVRLTGHGTFPNVILSGKTLGGSDDLHALHDSGKLKALLQKAGVKVEGNITANA